MLVPMPLTLPLPSWVPWWGQLLILVLAILFGLAFLMMPFAVFGLKGRLDFLEAQLDDIHAELRMLATRLPDPDRRPARAPAPVVQEIVGAPLPPLPIRTRTPAPPKPFATTPSEPVVAPRRPRVADDWSAPEPTSYDDEDAPRRTLSAREPDPRPVERNRSEPTLRWPPPR